MSDEPDSNPDNNMDMETVAVTQVVQFITPMSVYRPDGPFVRPPDFRIVEVFLRDQLGAGIDTGQDLLPL